MKTILLLTFVLMTALPVRAIDLQSVPHKVVGDNRTFIRDATDRRYSVWTDSQEKVPALLQAFDLKNESVTLKKGEIFAVFLNDRITEDLTGIIFHKTDNQCFADYADSGIKFRLRRLSEDKKFSHVTAVVFSPQTLPSHLGLRGMISNGLSEKQ